jgi:hypothetical protein
MKIFQTTFSVLCVTVMAAAMAMPNPEANASPEVVKGPVPDYCRPGIGGRYCTYVISFTLKPY